MARFSGRDGALTLTHKHDLISIAMTYSYKLCQLNIHDCLPNMHAAYFIQTC